MGWFPVTQAVPAAVPQCLRPACSGASRIRNSRRDALRNGRPEALRYITARSHPPQQGPQLGADDIQGPPGEVTQAQLSNDLVNNANATFNTIMPLTSNNSNAEIGRAHV